MQKLLFEDGDPNTVYEYMNARLRGNSVICINFFEKPEKCPICGSKNIRMIYHENA